MNRGYAHHSSPLPVHPSLSQLSLTLTHSHNTMSFPGLRMHPSFTLLSQSSPPSSSPHSSQAASSSSLSSFFPSLRLSTVGQLPASVPSSPTSASSPPRSSTSPLSLSSSSSPSSSSSAQPATSAPRPRFIWAAEPHKFLVQLAHSKRVWAASHGTVGSTWDTIAHAVTARFGGRAKALGRGCREKFEALCREAKAKQESASQRSGDSESWDELDQLLFQCNDEQATYAATAKLAKESEEKEIAGRTERQGELKEDTMRSLSQRAQRVRKRHQRCGSGSCRGDRSDRGHGGERCS